MGNLTTTDNQLVNEADVLQDLETSLDWESIGGRDSAASAGLILGQSVVHKFGAGIVTNANNVVWDNMETSDYPFKFTNTNMTVVSTSAGDTGQTIHIYYIELVGIDWVYKKGVAVTNGLTPVTIQEADDNFVSLGTDANIMFPFRMINKGTGQNAGGMLGNLTCQTGATVYAKITNGYNQSLMALFPIATGYSAFIHSIGRSVVGSAKACEFTYVAMLFGECEQTKIVKGLSSGSVDTVFDYPYFFEEKTILYVRASIDTGSASITSSFDLLLIENEYL